MRLPLVGGSYVARSIIASAQRCVNLFPEHNRKDALVPVTHYQRPGLRQLVQGGTNGVPVAPVRQLYRASNDNGYCVIGQNLYQISPTWQLTQLGQLTVPAGTPVSMIDNGTTLVLVDNSPVGYQVDLGSGAFSAIVDPTGTFQGATKVDTIDTFVLWNMPGTKFFGSTLSNEITFDALYFAGKTDYPDPLQTLVVNRHEIILLGSLKSEIWYDAGNPQFPFAELPGAYIEHGIVAPWSAGSADISVFWLSQDLQGQGYVFRQRGYQTTRISNHALEYALRQMVARGATLADAICYTYQQDGHLFYVLAFPSGDQTWAFDDSTEEWTQRAWTDPNGLLHRDRTNCHAFIHGTNVVGDWQNGSLYALDLNTYTDNGQPISWIRTFPQLGLAMGPQGPVEYDGHRLQVNKFVADIEVGEGLADLAGVPPQVGLRWSTDRGKTFKQTILQSLGSQGQYETQPQWLQEGIGRFFTFELSYSAACPAALNGAWVDARILDS